MAAWNREMIQKEVANLVHERTAGWSEAQLRTKLIDVLAGIHPIKYVLTGIVTNEAGRPNEGMAVTSALFPETFGEEPTGVSEPWTSVYNRDRHTFEPTPFKWENPPPKDGQWQSAEFRPGEVPHPDFPILSVWQYATAASISFGEFGTGEINAMIAACDLVAPN